jgi:DNA-binding XRE family transcriptional regulator
LQGFIAILPFRLYAEKPTSYPKHPATIGEHLLKRRCEQKLFQKDVGKQIGVSAWTIMNWEKGYSEPEVRYFSAIFAFLGYDPYPEPKTLSEKIIAWRRQNGVTRKSLARQLGIDEAALAKCEMDIASTTEEKAVQLSNLLDRQFGDLTP